MVTLFEAEPMGEVFFPRAPFSTPIRFGVSVYGNAPEDDPMAGDSQGDTQASGEARSTRVSGD